MKNRYLKIILKDREKRTISELVSLIKFYTNCSREEFNYAIMIDYYLNGKIKWTIKNTK